MVGHHEVDFALTAAPFGPYATTVLMEDQIVAAYPPGRQAPGHLALADLDDTVILNKAALETVLDNAEPTKAAITADRLVVQNVETELELVAAGVGIGILSQLPLTSLGQDLTSCPIKPAIKFDVGLICTDFAQLPPAAQRLADVVKEVVG